jgi:virulence factor Mce-like protein
VSPSRRSRMRAAKGRRDTYVGVIVLVLGLLGFYFSITKTLPFLGQSGRLVTAYFTEPNQLQAGNTPVRVDGINVGKVDSVSAIDGGRYGKVVMRITDSSLQLHSDASAQAQFRTLLGANFVIQLNPGSQSAPPLGNNAIPRSRTGVQTEFDDVLQAFSGNTPAATRADLKQLSSALSGSQLGTLIDTVPSALGPTTKAFRALQGTDPGDLSGLVSSASQATDTLAADRTDLETLINQGDTALGSVAGQSAALGQTLDEAPGALDQTVAVTHSLNATIKPLNRLLTALAPGAKALGPAAATAQPAVEYLRTVLDQAKPLLASLRPAVNQLAAASGPGKTLLSGLEPTLNRLNSQLIPWLQSDDSDLDRPIYQLIAPTLASLGSAAAEADSNSHVLHFPIQPEANSVTLLPCTIFVAAPTPSQILECDNLNQVLSVLLTGSTGSSATAASTTTTSAENPAEVTAK